MSSIGRRQLPGSGFVIFCLSYGLLGLLAAWGLSRPPADEIWELMQQIRLGRQQGLSRQDLRLLQQETAAHPQLLASLDSENRSLVILSPHRAGRLATATAVVLRRPGVSLTLKPEQTLDVVLKGFDGQSGSWSWERRIGLTSGQSVRLPANARAELVQIAPAKALEVRP